MTIHSNTLKKAKHFMLAIEIGDKVLANSNFQDSLKNGIRAQAVEAFEYTEKSIAHNSLPSVYLKSYMDSYFVFWNEHISLTTELFWKNLQDNAIEIERKDPFEYALRHNRFRTVHQGIPANLNWKTIKESKLLLNRFTQNQVDQIEAIIQSEELKRVSVLKKCIRNNNSPISNGMRVNDSLAFMEQCSLFEKYFSQEEYDQLHEIISRG